VDADLVTALCAGRPFFKRADALALGLDDRGLRSLVKTKAVVRPRHGTYFPYAAWRDASDLLRHRWLLMAVMHDARTPVVASHASALVAHGGPTWHVPLDTCHVLRLDGKAGRAEAGVRQHRGAVREGDCVEVDGLAVTSPARTALDLSTVVGLEASIVVMDWFLHEGKVDHAALVKRSQAYSQVPNSLHTDLAVRLADGRRESVGESRTGFLVWRGGLPAPETQYPVVDGRGREIARLDFAWPELKVWLEFDGMQKYVKFLEPGQSVSDAVMAERRRERMLRELLGWECIRIDWKDLAHPLATASYIRSALAGTVRPI